MSGSWKWNSFACKLSYSLDCAGLINQLLSRTSGTISLELYVVNNSSVEIKG